MRHIALRPRGRLGCIFRIQKLPPCLVGQAVVFWMGELIIGEQGAAGKLLMPVVRNDHVNRQCPPNPLFQNQRLVQNSGKGRRDVRYNRHVATLDGTLLT